MFFNDINPQAEIHVLGIPKFPCTSFSDFIKNADNIIVLDKGRIIEEGKHNKLLKMKGIYSDLWSVQVGI